MTLHTLLPVERGVRSLGTKLTETKLEKNNKTTCNLNNMNYITLFNPVLQVNYKIIYLCD